MLRFAVDVGGTIRESRIQLLRALSRLTITVLLRIRWAYHCFNPHRQQPCTHTYSGLFQRPLTCAGFSLLQRGLEGLVFKLSRKFARIEFTFALLGLVSVIFLSLSIRIWQSAFRNRT